MMVIDPSTANLWPNGRTPRLARNPAIKRDSVYPELKLVDPCHVHDLTRYRGRCGENYRPPSDLWPNGRAPRSGRRNGPTGTEAVEQRPVRCKLSTTQPRISGPTAAHRVLARRNGPTGTEAVKLRFIAGLTADGRPGGRTPCLAHEERPTGYPERKRRGDQQRPKGSRGAERRQGQHGPSQYKYNVFIQPPSSCGWVREKLKATGVGHRDVQSP